MSGLGDLLAVTQVMRRIAAREADVVHGHGAKGGTYARLACSRRAACVNGSFGYG